MRLTSLFALAALLGTWNARSEPLASVNNFIPLTATWDYAVRIRPLDGNGDPIDALTSPQILWTFQQQTIMATIPPSPTPYTFTGVNVGYYIFKGTGVKPLKDGKFREAQFNQGQATRNIPAGIPLNCVYSAPTLTDSDLTCTPGLDAVPPSAPGPLLASISGVSTINLIWGTATDNVGVTGYGVERCLGATCAAAFALVGNTAGTAFSDSGLASGQAYTYRVRANDAANNFGPYSNIAVMTTPVPPPADTTPPVVSITAPLAGATVVGTATLTASASDNVGVVGVQFGLDSVNFSAEITAPPYTTIWNTTTVADGPHTINAVARDAAGNRASSALVVVQVSNAPPPPPPPSGSPVFTVLGTDAFTGTTLGPSWATNFGELPFKVVGGAAVPTSFQSDNGARYIGAPIPAGQYSRGNLFVSGTRGDRQGIGFVLRQSATARTNYRFVIDHAATGNASITKRIAGTGKVLGIWTMPFTDGDQVTFAITSSGVLYVFDKNGAVAKTIDDSASQIVGGTVGIDFSSISTSASIRNWEGGAFSFQ